MKRKTPNAQRPTSALVFGNDSLSSTSSLSNHGEAEAAESRRDFLHKLRICLKELRETNRWLRLVGRLNKLGPPANFAVCVNEVEELIRIFVASIRTAERNAK
jgi:four helix bundle protein